jgi:sugar transferase (PEP-CTERM/EpsH1 system associated)
LAGWLVSAIGIDPGNVVQIYNGVDVTCFRPSSEDEDSPERPDFAAPEAFVIGSVCRMHPVKDPLTLARSFVQFLEAFPAARNCARLLLVGDGPSLGDVRAALFAAGVGELAWLAGERSDVASLLRLMDVFVLPSIAEGISNTILEAMATGLPVVATQVGGTPELVEPDQTGTLVPPANPARMAEAIGRYFTNRSLAVQHGYAGRARVERNFSMESMVEGYLEVYDSVLSRGGAVVPGTMEVHQ